VLNVISFFVRQQNSVVIAVQDLGGEFGCFAYLVGFLWSNGWVPRI